jgi:phospholipid/cholesterol/gamma-HCH transport system substrate-binding protein
MSSTARLGAFILLSLIIFGVMVFWIGDRQFLFSRTYQIKAPFENVAGLDEGAPVRAGGVRIGTVERIHLPHQPADKISVILELENSTREVIRKDSIASIETEGLLGSKYVAISFGSLENGQVTDGDTIDSRPPIDYADVAKKTSDLLDSAKEAIDSSKVAIGNINESSNDLKSITGKIDSGQGTIGAMLNDQSIYHSLNATVDQARAGANAFQENMEALKHNFFLRGFFKKRGYYNPAELTRHAVAKLPKRAPLRTFTFDGKDLFGKPDSAKLGKEKLLNEVGAFLENNPYGLAVIATQTSLSGEQEKNLQLSQARAMIVRQYLAQKFRIDDARVKTLGMGEGDQTATDKGGRIAIVIYANGQDSRLTQAKNR